MVKTSCFHCKETQVRSLLGELRSHMLHDTGQTSYGFSLTSNKAGRRNRSWGEQNIQCVSTSELTGVCCLKTYIFCTVELLSVYTLGDLEESLCHLKFSLNLKPCRM